MIVYWCILCIFFWQVLSSSQYLVGNQLSRADVHLMEATLMLEELHSTILSTFPNLKVKLILFIYCCI